MQKQKDKEWPFTEDLLAKTLMKLNEMHRQKQETDETMERTDKDDTEEATKNPPENRTRTTRSRRIDEGGDEPQLTVYRRLEVSCSCCEEYQSRMPRPAN